MHEQHLSRRKTAPLKSELAQLQAECATLKLQVEHAATHPGQQTEPPSDEIVEMQVLIEALP